MSVFSRPDSKYWWLWLETAPKGYQKIRTDILVGFTKEERKASKNDAEAVYYARMLEAGKVRHGLPVLKDALTFDAFAGWYDTHEIARHRGKVRERKILPRLRTAFGHLDLTDPTWREAVIAWRTERMATPIRRPRAGRRKARLYPPASPATVNREVGLLQQMLSKAAELKHIPSSPLNGLRHLKGTKPLRRIMSPEEESRILTELPPIDRAILIAGLDTLARLGDLLDLKWADYHGDTLDIVDPKNRTPLTVPVSARLKAALAAVPRDPKRPAYIFGKRRSGATPEGWVSTVIGSLKAACERADVPYGRRKNGVTFHWATRRTGATRMIRQGGEKAIGVVQQIGGWKKVDVLVGIYQEVVTAEMRAAVETVATTSTPALFPRPAKVTRMARKRA